ncbi:hypothetical protein ABB37_07370 [Leptomonas pyrrhocoris]|uniref:Uncharacterized protein n=1 Tax=Leptomonas pyrrhocoris TaxID=157538 RepID=A0A0M9FVM6_LEPPY|nr:hypothetical protein ABB37_07370 [Leptomonas pyrrhocoris]XP_015655459.1 hypothetical protein ABB37_07370 [Leptomonas pyrrhocoris]KPA77019.1 hypothetical protein ABB37_07370 [Leptomonas pyrrhocoris]KPA77020.1 hypothetical protein ABB37_07370 [Leptomonas pyrrhocoris]|eukprot:XP_015655458.1 hypothetical protein ABB37_07370 [Leptomonas pyrrhocoris]
MDDIADAVDLVKPLPPHGPANMMSLYMTRYDYDYNRDGEQDGSGNGSGGGGAFDAGISGDVRNRPIFGYGTPEGDRDARTIYQVDYTPKDRSVKDMQSLVASVKGGGPAAALADGTENGTAYQREWYRPGLTVSLVNDDGTLPRTAYQEDYTQPISARAAGPPFPSTVAPSIYVGAAATAYNADLLKPHDAQEDDGADIVPKITSKESLLPRSGAMGWTVTFDGAPTTVTRACGPPCTLGPASGLPGMYSCTSWDIGDVSQAHPSQLPVSLANSIATKGVDVTAYPDKAALLHALAGRKTKPVRGSGGGAPREEYDRTNPQFLSAQAQKRCAVSRRLEEEHHVHMSMYKSDYVDQSQQPELPGNPAGPADARDTLTCPTSTPGEMMAGQLTKSTREMGLLRNSHGTLKPAAAAAAEDTAVLTWMRATEKAIAIDRADPHRHKLH